MIFMSLICTLFEPVILIKFFQFIHSIVSKIFLLNLYLCKERGPAFNYEVNAPTYLYVYFETYAIPYTITH